ncbi:MAG TPA: ribonuclease III domain-containing protein [Tissierellaceae bacterium]|nr:ribonuclease III domain-containing protein [Tissierellaceae bacterium]
MEKQQNIFRMTNEKLTREDIAMLSPLQLAYIGDAVYELLVRTYLLEKESNVNQLHKKATKYVKADAQSEIIHHLEDILREDEKKIIKRGRNAKTNTSPKNSSMINYKYATGFESLFGYLYLTGQDGRILELFDNIKVFEKNKI